MELAEEYAMRQKTVWDFKRKIQSAMQSSGNYPLEGVVHVDEFYVGGEEEGVTGRSLDGKKKLVIIALEIVPGGVGRAYAQVIEDASADSFRPFFEKYISKDAKIVTDEWNGYLPLKRLYEVGTTSVRQGQRTSGNPHTHHEYQRVAARNTSSLLKGAPARLPR